MRSLGPKIGGPIRVRASEVARSLDTNRSGHVTIDDFPPGGKLTLRARSADGHPIDLELGADEVGLAARIHEYARRHGSGDGELVIPAEIFEETPTSRALLAADAYDSSTRAMDPHRLLDMLLLHPDRKVGTLGAGLRDQDGHFRRYRVVGEDGQTFERTASYGGRPLYLYVPAFEREVLDVLERRQRDDPRYSEVRIVPFLSGELGSRESRLTLRFDRPGVLWLSTRCPLLPDIHDDQVIVPGARFGVEAYYHDARINAPGARSTIEALIAGGGDADARREATRVLSAIRGTANLFIHQVGTLGKVLNANLSVYLSRSQPPCLTTCAKEIWAAWCALHVGDERELAAAKTWLAWALEAAIREYHGVWMAPPRIDPKTRLSRYVDETPSEAPEEVPHHYAGLAWGAEEIAADAAIREHGWDTHVGALALVGPDRGRPSQHRMLPVCLNSLLYRYEKDIAEMLAAVGRGGEAPDWEARAEARRQRMDALMWNEARGLYFDLIGVGEEYRQNGYEDLRSLMPLWAGMVDRGNAKAERMVARAGDFLRKGGVACATEASWEQAHALNPSFVERCQWGHKSIGWPIATYETVAGLRRAGANDIADEIAYRWCWMVQREMDRQGGLQYSGQGGYEAPIMEKMDVAACTHGGDAQLGYGNQGAGREGEGGGFRWGYDAFKLLVRSLPKALREALEAGVDPDLRFGSRGR